MTQKHTYDRDYTVVTAAMMWIELAYEKEAGLPTHGIDDLNAWDCVNIAHQLLQGKTDCEQSIKAHKRHDEFMALVAKEDHDCKEEA